MKTLSEKYPITSGLPVHIEILYQQTHIQQFIHDWGPNQQVKVQKTPI